MVGFIEWFFICCLYVHAVTNYAICVVTYYFPNMSMLVLGVVLPKTCACISDKSLPPMLMSIKAHGSDLCSQDKQSTQALPRVCLCIYYVTPPVFQNQQTN